jgi:hypothetical protein
MTICIAWLLLLQYVTLYFDLWAIWRRGQIYEMTSDAPFGCAGSTPAASTINY